MANSNNNPVALAWSSSSPVALNSANRFVSDAVSISADAAQGAISVLADNQGTPASGDVVDLWVAWSVDGTNYDTDEHAQFLGRLDTYASNDPGEDPARRSFALYVSGKQKLKLVARAAQGASRTINLSAVYNEHRLG